MLEESSEFRELEKAVEKIKSSFKVYAVTLLAIELAETASRGVITTRDCDLVVIADLREKYLDRIMSVLKVVGDVRLNIEPHPYALEEAREMLRKGNPLIVEAASQGIVLYKTEKFEELVKLYRELVNRGLRRTGTSYELPR